MAESKRKTARSDQPIDTDPTDNFTEQVYAQAGKLPPSESGARSYMYNELGILKGVELGLGRSVVYEPMLQRSKLAKAVWGFKPLDVPIYLQCHSMNFHSACIQAVYGHLASKGRDFLRS